MPTTCAIRNALSISTSAVPTRVAMRVSRPLTKGPMMSARPVKISSAIIGSGSAIDSTTWLTTKASVAFTP